jgi:hypothetical protein
MNITKNLKDICSPAKLYLGVSIVTISLALFRRTRLVLIFMKVIFVMFWTYLLNLLCQKGLKSISWFLVLLPYIIISLAFFMNFDKTKEGFSDRDFQLLLQKIKLSASEWSQVQALWSNVQSRAEQLAVFAEYNANSLLSSKIFDILNSIQDALRQIQIGKSQSEDLQKQMENINSRSLALSQQIATLTAQSESTRATLEMLDSTKSSNLQSQLSQPSQVSQTSQP